MNPEIVISVVLTKSIQKGGNYATVKGVSNILKKIKDEFDDIEGIYFKRIPGGFYSDNVEEFVGHLLLWDFAKQDSPIILTEEGEELLRENVAIAKKTDPQRYSMIENYLTRI